MVPSNYLLSTRLCTTSRSRRHSGQQKDRVKQSALEVFFRLSGSEQECACEVFTAAQRACNSEVSAVTCWRSHCQNFSCAVKVRVGRKTRRGQAKPLQPSRLTSRLSSSSALLPVAARQVCLGRLVPVGLSLELLFLCVTCMLMYSNLR